MQVLKKWIIIATLALPPISCFCNTEKKETEFSELHKKTTYGFAVPFVLRYNPDEWLCRHVDGGHKFKSEKNYGLSFTIVENKEEKNLSQKYLDQVIEESFKEDYSDPNLYSKVEIFPSEYVTINEVNFLHHKVILHLAPKSVHFESLGKVGHWKKRYVSEKGEQTQMDFYTFSGDKGLILFKFKSDNLISQEDQESIKELFRGFSFDGSACKGPGKLRALKTVFDVLTSQ